MQRQKFLYIKWDLLHRKNVQMNVVIVSCVLTVIPALKKEDNMN